MQSQQPAYVPAVQVHDSDEAMHEGGDAWSRSVGLVIFAIPVIGVLFVGALLLMYFGMVQSKDAPEVVPPAAVDAPAPRVPPAAPEVPPAPVAVDAPAIQLETIAEAPARSEQPPAVSLPPEARGAAPTPREPRSTSEPNPRAAAAVPRARREAAPASVPDVVAVAAPLSAPPNAAAAKAETSAAVASAAPSSTIGPAATQVAAVELAPARPSAPAAVARVTVATDGQVSAVTIVSSNPPRLFDRAVRNALADWRFEPIPRPTTAQIDFAFRAE